MGIDWESIAKQVGGLDQDGNERIAGTPGARRALEILLGEKNLRDVVDYFLSSKPGCLTAEMVLSIIGSPVAMQRCYEIYKTEHGTERAAGAVFLLGSFATYEVLPWIHEFLEDREPAIRLNGLKSLQRVVNGPLNDEDSDAARRLFDTAESDSDQAVRERAVEIRSHLPSHQKHLK